MTPCTCQKWREHMPKEHRADGNSSDYEWHVFQIASRFDFCPWCSASLTSPEKPREEGEWRFLGLDEKPDGLQGDEFLDDYGKWVLSNGRYDITVSQINARNEFVRQYRTKRPLPTQPEE